MPIGTSKTGVMGGGLAPGGTETFNSSGTFTAPAGITSVNVTGNGAAGNAGNTSAGGQGFGAGGNGGNGLFV